jgi:shikimate kinase
MSPKKNRVILIGYRATGKSSIGRLLANKLGFDFVDMDRVIEERESSSISDMVAKHDWPYFRSKEKILLQELIDKKNIVIATGGGAVLHHEIWPKIMQSFVSVWLFAEHETICQRLANDTKSAEQRPSLTGQNILAEVEKLMADREPLYRKYSHLAINTSHRSLDAVVHEIERALKADQT